MLTFSLPPSLFFSPVFLLPSPHSSPPLSPSHVPLPLFFLFCLFSPLSLSHTPSSLSLLPSPPGTKDFGTAVGVGGSADVTLVATQVEPEAGTDPSSLLVLDKAYRVTITARGGTVLYTSNLVVTMIHTFLENMKSRSSQDSSAGFLLQT